MKAEKIKIDTTAIPDHVRHRPAEATLDFIREIMRQPGGCEMLDTGTAARQRAALEKG